jgi:hypothetical protein
LDCRDGIALDAGAVDDPADAATDGQHDDHECPQAESEAMSPEIYERLARHLNASERQV